MKSTSIVGQSIRSEMISTGWDSKFRVSLHGRLYRDRISHAIFAMQKPSHSGVYISEKLTRNVLNQDSLLSKPSKEKLVIYRIVTRQILKRSCHNISCWKSKQGCETQNGSKAYINCLRFLRICLICASIDAGESELLGLFFFAFLDGSTGRV
jgi:hypothetical protein